MHDDRPALFLFREDLRITDNPALHAAAQSGRPLICVFILDDTQHGYDAAGGARLWWLYHSLTALAADLDAAGGTLIVRRGAQGNLIQDLVRETNAAEVYWTRRYGPDQIAIDTRVKTALESDGVKVVSMNGRLLFEPWTFKTGAGRPYRVFTPFWKAIKARGSVRPPVPRVERIVRGEHELTSLSINDLGLLPTSPDWAAQFSQTWKPGEAGAREKLEQFMDAAAASYKEDRNRPDLIGTSGLSPHLQHGEISPVQIWQAIQMAVERGDIPAAEADVFLSEVVWREFSYVLLFDNPDMLELEIQPPFRSFPWQDNPDALAAWQKGETGYPIVDAGMRQLWQTGWMHNRVRMIVASFLIKHLMVDWRHGMRWFWDTLVDADIAANTASWQWVAGCGADAAPYFRVFNPITQGEKFDPAGDYVRRFVPEIANLPNKYLNRPWEAPREILDAADLVLGRDYPKPIVDHKTARERALAAYAEMRG